jgi:hypothetical protein
LHPIAKGKTFSYQICLIAIIFVNGSIYTSKIKVQLMWLSDFVFDKNYCTMSICESENYFKLNKHLPVFISEQELIENGHQLAEKIALQQNN